MEVKITRIVVDPGQAEAANSRTKKALELLFNQVQISFTSEQRLDFALAVDQKS